MGADSPARKHGQHRHLVLEAAAAFGVLGAFAMPQHHVVRLAAFAHAMGGGQAQPRAGGQVRAFTAGAGQAQAARFAHDGGAVAVGLLRAEDLLGAGGDQRGLQLEAR